MPGSCGAVKSGETSLDEPPLRTALAPAGAPPTMAEPGVRVAKNTFPL